MARSGVRLPVLQRLMGHADDTTTLRYIQLSMADIADEYRRAVEQPRRPGEQRVPCRGRPGGEGRLDRGQLLGRGDEVPDEGDPGRASRRRVEELGPAAVAALTTAPWPRNLDSLRESAPRLLALVEHRTIRAAAAALGLTRQALASALDRLGVAGP